MVLTAAAVVKRKERKGEEKLDRAGGGGRSYTIDGRAAGALGGSVAPSECCSPVLRGSGAQGGGGDMNEMDLFLRVRMGWTRRACLRHPLVLDGGHIIDGDGSLLGLHVKHSATPAPSNARQRAQLPSHVHPRAAVMGCPPWSRGRAALETLRGMLAPSKSITCPPPGFALPDTPGAAFQKVERSRWRA